MERAESGGAGADDGLEPLSQVRGADVPPGVGGELPPGRVERGRQGDLGAAEAAVTSSSVMVTSSQVRAVTGSICWPKTMTRMAAARSRAPQPEVYGPRTCFGSSYLTGMHGY